MKVLIVSTSTSSLRSQIQGWSVEDSNLYVPNKPIGFTPGPDYNIVENSPKTILESLSYGWKLLAPPKKDQVNNEWDW